VKQNIFKRVRPTSLPCHPCLFLTAWPSFTLNARLNLTGFKVPEIGVFESLPKTSTGKIEKYKLRERARTI
jgi:fatty-acyl-CoA synthase